MADDYDAIRKERFRELMAGRWRRRLAIGGAVVVALGLVGAIATPVLLVLAAAGALVALVVVGVSWSTAGADAEDAVLTRWGTARGLAFVAEPAVAESTGFLRRGDRRTFENGLVGPIGGCPGSVLCHYTYITKRTVTDGNGTRTEEQSHPYTVALLPVGDAVARALPRLSVTRRGLTGGLLDGLGSTLTGDEVLELESAELDDRYRIAVRDGTSPIVVRRLFEPDFMVWLSDAHARKLELELESGHLVLWREGRIREPARLDALLDDAAHVADRLRAAPDVQPTSKEQTA